MATTTFTCECGKTRKIPNAAKHEVTRCDDCQIEYKRRKGRERYRRRKGLALDYVPPARKKERLPRAVHASSWLDPEPRPEPVAPIPEYTPEEQIERSAKLKKLMALLDDDSTDDDW